jgi:hypothetical protein
VSGLKAYLYCNRSAKLGSNSFDLGVVRDTHS